MPDNRKIVFLLFGGSRIDLFSRIDHIALFVVIDALRNRRKLRGLRRPNSFSIGELLLRLSNAFLHLVNRHTALRAFILPIFDLLSAFKTIHRVRLLLTAYQRSGD